VPSTGEIAVSFAGAGKRFGDRWVVHDLDLEIPRGSIFGMIGPSGCGKTTTVRLANGVYRPDAGSVELLGAPPSTLPPHRRAAIGYLPQRPALFADLSLWENLNFHASLNGVRFRRRRRLEELLELVDLQDDRRKLVRESSGGMQRRLALAATLVHRPAFLILDEPTAGIDPILRRRFWDHFRSLAGAGHTLVVTTQHVEEAADCDVVGLLAEGALAALGTPDQLRRQAAGGEIIEVEVDRVLEEQAIVALAQVARASTYQRVDGRRVRMIVDDGGASLPMVLKELERHGVGVVDSEEVVLPYDDMFIRLVAASTGAAA
jgi:ABC-2 type transport system ATP-binding protein